jgi:hypothetical protein
MSEDLTHAIQAGADALERVSLHLASIDTALERQNELLERIANQMPATDQDGAAWVRMNG